MSRNSKKQEREVIDAFNRIQDEQVRYFYYMLGTALADAAKPTQAVEGEESKAAAA